MLKSFSFTKKYIFALSIIALLSTLAYFNMDHLINIQYNDAKIINLSSRQKILAQQIALYAIYYKTKNLAKNIKLMEKSHNILIKSPMSNDLKKLYFQKPIELDKKIRTFLHHAKKFQEKRAGLSLTYLLKNSSKLLKELEKALSIYLQQAEEHTDNLKRVELIIFLLTVLTLLFEALLIFRPANIQINKKTNELINQKEYLNKIIQTSTNAIITLDERLHVKTYNKMAKATFGYEIDEVINTSILEKIITKEYKSHLVNKILEKNENVEEIDGIDKNGKKFPMRISVGVNKKNKDLTIVITMQNISQEKLNDKILQEQAKFAALGEMIAVIAHQWRQPLSQLNFNCMYIKSKLTDKELINEIEDNSDIIHFMSETITNFQDFYKKTDNSNFNPIISIEQALKLVSSTLSLNQIQIKKEIDSKITIYGNSNTLAHVVLSMIQNTIDIIKNKNISNPTIHISLKDTSKHIELIIADNAGGIQISPINDIFKPFISKKKTTSTGIGLYMSKLVIEDKFKGSIIAKNINKGALFLIKLPH